jgi:hypothetical protein
MEFNIDIDRLSQTEQVLVAEYAGLMLDIDAAGDDPDAKLDSLDPLVSESFKVLTKLRAYPHNLDDLEFQQLVDRCVDGNIQAVKEMVRLGKRIRAEK